MTAPVYTTVNQDAVADFFVKRYNIVGADAEYKKNRPTLSSVPRDMVKLKQGDGFFETLKIADGWAGAPGWAEGNKYHVPSQTVKWAVTDPFVQVARIGFDNLTMNRNNTGTLIDLKAPEIDGVKENMLNTCEFELWSDGSGARGQIDVLGGSEATRVLTLKTASDVYNFPHGTLLQGSTAATGGTLHTDIYRVSANDPVNGQITAVQVTNTAGQELADEDFLHVISSKSEYMPGIPTFIPSSAPSDTLYGVTRNGDPALSGWRFPFVASIGETISRAFMTMGRWVNRGAQKFVVCLSAGDWYALSQEREGRIMEDPGAMQKWGLTGLQLRTPFGPISVITIPQLADGRGYILDFSTWKLYTLGNLPHVITDDGRVFLRGGFGSDTTPGTHEVGVDGDFIYMQLRMWKVLLCLQPLSNATFPTVAS